MLINNLINRDKNEDIKKQKKNNGNEEQIESFSDSIGNLNNERNPFIKAQNESNKKSDSNSNNIKEKGKNLSDKYNQRDPMYYYYIIKGIIYKYT